MTQIANNKHVLIGAQSNDHTARLAGISSKRFFTDALTFARIQFLVAEFYRLGFMLKNKVAFDMKRFFEQ